MTIFLEDDDVVLVGDWLFPTAEEDSGFACLPPGPKNRRHEKQLVVTLGLDKRKAWEGPDFKAGNVEVEVDVEVGSIPSSGGSGRIS